MILNPVLHGSFLFTNSQFSQRAVASKLLSSTILAQDQKMSFSETKLTGTHVLVENILSLNED